MKRVFWKSIPLAAWLLLGSPAIAHVGHGDEFQATGNLARVEVNADTDGQLGIKVTPIDAAADGNVLVPATALVTEDEQSFAFVKYENFYEPVAVTTGATQGDLVAITEGLSAGEQLVTQGGLSLYAQSRRKHEESHDHEHGPSLKKSAALVTLVVLAVGGAFVVTSRNQRQDETPVA